MNTQFRSLPSVDRIVSDERIKALEGVYSHALIVRVARQCLELERHAVGEGKPASTVDDITHSVLSELESIGKPGLRPLINATGVVLHTNLGRAPLSKEAARAMEVASLGFSNLEFDLKSGARGSRQTHIEKLLCRLSGAEAALVVNNNAAAVLLGLAALAKRKEVVVSRGQAVEIGDSFRIPDVMRQSGARLVEVGTTNCTYVSDYEQAVNEHTAALMRVHSSNFLVIGFTHSVSIEELGGLGKRTGLPVLDDLGSGAFLDTTAFGLSAEPMVQDSVAAGAGLAFFSGDKLVGGPQAGIIVGKKPLIDKLKRHPLARAVRIDKIRLAGLAATIVHYLRDEASEKIPVWRMISTQLVDIERRAHGWADGVGSRAQVIEGESMIGGGSLPGGTLPTKLLAIRGKAARKGQSEVQTLGRKLREYDPPIIGRISEDVLLLDPRTVFPEEDAIVIAALRESLESAG